MFLWFFDLALLDKILIIILGISIFAKWIGDLLTWFMCRRLNRDKSCKKQCIYLNTENDHDCTLEVYRQKYFINHGCSKKRCPGYRTSNNSIDDLKKLYKWRFLILAIFKWISEISTIILIIRTLIISYTIIG